MDNVNDFIQTYFKLGLTDPRVAYLTNKVIIKSVNSTEAQSPEHFRVMRVELITGPRTTSISELRARNPMATAFVFLEPLEGRPQDSCTGLLDSSDLFTVEVRQGILTTRAINCGYTCVIARRQNIVSWLGYAIFHFMSKVAAK